MNTLGPTSRISPFSEAIKLFPWNAKYLSQNLIFSARKPKPQKRFLSQSKTRRLCQSVCILASRLKLFPEPVNNLIQEFGGGNGNGSGNGILKRLGGNGGSGWWRRRRKWNFLLVGFLVMLGLLLGREFESGIFLCLSLLVEKDWILGLFCMVALVGLGARTEAMNKWFERVKILDIVRGKRRKSRRRVF